jgi:hypothetical protein
MRAGLHKSPAWLCRRGDLLEDFTQAHAKVRTRPGATRQVSGLSSSPVYGHDPGGQPGRHGRPYKVAEPRSGNKGVPRRGIVPAPGRPPKASSKNLEDGCGGRRCRPGVEPHKLAEKPVQPYLVAGPFIFWLSPFSFFLC